MWKLILLNPIKMIHLLWKGERKCEKSGDIFGLLC